MSVVIAEKAMGRRVVRLIQGDITFAETDAIVNPANSHLRHGGGVAGAIVRRGGAEIPRGSDQIGFCAEGEAVVTAGGQLAARYVIHAVGPRGEDPQGDEKLAGAVRNSLLRAQELGLRSVSLPAISSGIFGFPKDRCARVLLDAVEKFFRAHPDTAVEQADFVIIDQGTVRFFRQAWEERWG